MYSSIGVILVSLCSDAMCNVFVCKWWPVCIYLTTCIYVLCMEYYASCYWVGTLAVDWFNYLIWAWAAHFYPSKSFIIIIFLVKNKKLKAKLERLLVRNQNESERLYYY